MSTFIHSSFIGIFHCFSFQNAPLNEKAKTSPFLSWLEKGTDSDHILLVHFHHQQAHRAHYWNVMVAAAAGRRGSKIYVSPDGVLGWGWHTDIAVRQNATLKNSVKHCIKVSVTLGELKGFFFPPRLYCCVTVKTTIWP